MLSRVFVEDPGQEPPSPLCGLTWAFPGIRPEAPARGAAAALQGQEEGTGAAGVGAPHRRCWDWARGQMGVPSEEECSRQREARSLGTDTGQTPPASYPFRAPGSPTCQVLLPPKISPGRGEPPVGLAQGALLVFSSRKGCRGRLETGEQGSGCFCAEGERCTRSLVGVM